MAAKKPFVATMYLKYLPKPEYKAMKAMVEHFGFTDESELFAVLVALGYEVCRFEGGRGRAWLLNVLDAHRSRPEAERVYPPLGLTEDGSLPL